MDKIAQILSSGSKLNFGNFHLPITFVQAGAIVVLLFILITLFAQLRHHFVDWSLKGALFGMFFGFILALIFEGFLIIGGRTALTGVLGWKNAPKPLQIALDAGRSKLIQVLGIQNQIPSSIAKENSTIQSALTIIQSLNPNDVKKVKAIFCQP